MKSKIREKPRQNAVERRRDRVRLRQRPRPAVPHPERFHPGGGDGARGVDHGDGPGLALGDHGHVQRGRIRQGERASVLFERNRLPKVKFRGFVLCCCR